MTTPAPPTDRRRERHLAKRATIVAEAWTLARRDGLAAISLRDLADLGATTLATMHGSAFDGDTAAALNALADSYDQRLLAAG